MQQQQDTITIARYRVYVMNELYRAAQQVDTRPFLRNIMAAQTYESKIEYELLSLKASGFQAFFCEEQEEYQLVPENDDGGEEGRHDPLCS